MLFKKVIKKIINKYSLFLNIICYRVNVINDNDNDLNESIDETSNQQQLANNKSTRLFVSKRLNFLFTMLSIIGLLSYTLFIFFCSNKQEYENLHPYLTIVPVT